MTAQERRNWITGGRATVRWMIARDLPAVLDIEAGCGEWDEEQFRAALRNRTTIGMVACDPAEEREILGFMVYTLEKKLLVLQKFAVHPEFRRRGIGSALLARLVYKCEQHKRERIVFEGAGPDFDWLARRSRPTPHGAAGVWELRPPVIKDEWLSADVQKLCSGKKPPYFGALADALEEAGCDDRFLLALFRARDAGEEYFWHVRTELAGWWPKG
jgi:GNAT superfamily N-acetyltransferase